MLYRSDYIQTTVADAHKARGRYILKHYPQVKSLMTCYPWSMVYIISIVGFQIALAAWVENQPWWIFLSVSFFIGSILSHALFVLLHDNSHNLVFRNGTVSKAIAIFINIGQGFFSGIEFTTFHLQHHTRMGDYDEDLDIPHFTEGRIVKNTLILKTIWLFFLGVITGFRPMGRGVSVVNKWSLINVLVIVITNLIIVYFIGWYALLYILISTFFGLGVHPVGARWIQEHFIFRKKQETYSYYGIGNKFSFNVGYHNEHHDLMGIPWVNLPKLKRMVPELYEPLYAHTSWVKLYFRFIFDKRISLFNRIVRKEDY